MVIREADEISLFIQVDVIVTPDQNEKKGKGKEADIDEGYKSTEREFGFKTIHKSKKWTSEQLRKILQKQSKKWLGDAISIRT